MTEFDNVLLPTEVIPFEPMLAMVDFDGQATLSPSAIPQVGTSGDLILQDAGDEGDNWIALLHATASSDALAGGIVDVSDDALFVNPIATPDEEEEQVITINGWDGGGGGATGGGTDSGYTGGDGMGSGGTGTGEPNQTPCVETTLNAGVSTHDANREALKAANKIMTASFESYEYSAIIWAKNGVVGHTEPYTQNLVDQVNFLGRISSVPDGAVIIGIVHSHPDGAATVDSYPSGAGSDEGADWDAYDQIVNHTGLPRGITVDRNMLLWIANAEDSKVRVYDNTDKNLTQPSCAIN
jgi:proteasome lid subunit RPN8/RPN11